MEKSIIKRIMTSKEAIEYLGCSEYSFEQEVKRGNISFKAVGRIRLFPVWALDKWLNDTTNLLDCSKEARYTTHTSRSFPRDNEFALENLLEQLTNKQPQNTALNAYQKSKQKTTTKPQVNCLA